VRPLTAMTGEITLSGQCAAGGRHQGEVSGGAAAGSDNHHLPAENRQDVEEDLTAK